MIAIWGTLGTKLIGTQAQKVLDSLGNWWLRWVFTLGSHIKNGHYDLNYTQAEVSQIKISFLESIN